MSITAYASNKILDRNFGNTSFSVPATYYFGLSTTPPAFDGTGATEPVGAAYARIGATNNKTNWSTAALGILSNAAAITFVESSGSWGTITHVFIADALSAGNIWYWEALSASRTVATSTTVLFAIGGLQVKMNNT